MNNIAEIADSLKNNRNNIILIYAFNTTGKTRLSVEYKNRTKDYITGIHTGVYYNAYSEDLFVWDNDDDNDGSNKKLKIIESSLNHFHSAIDEEKIYNKLKSYKPKFDFKFNYHENIENGIQSVSFYPKIDDEIEKNVNFENSETLDVNPLNKPIKISRGEQQIFIWSFFLSLFDIEDWTGKGNQSEHFFIDDPVSSLDDHNIFVTISSLVELIDYHFKDRKIIITTHHIGFFSILADWLTRGEKAQKYKKDIEILKLVNKDGNLELVNTKKEVFLYHLELLRILEKAIVENQIYVYHFALLRQVLENINSFLGGGNFSYILKEIGFNDEGKIANLINIMSHKTVFRYEFSEPVPDNKQDIINIVNAIQNKYHFKLHL